MYKESFEGVGGYSTEKASTTKVEKKSLTKHESGMSIMMHESEPTNRNEKQLQLAHDIFIEVFGEDSLENMAESEKAGTILAFWVDENQGYAKTYSDLEKSDAFKNHERISGNFLMITPEDIIEYKKTGELPE